MKTFKNFLLEKKEDIKNFEKKITYIVPEISSTEDGRNKFFNDIWNVLYAVKGKSNIKEVPTEGPILYYAFAEGGVPEVLPKNIDRPRLYNRPEETIKGRDKTTMHKLFHDETWFTKAVFTKEEAINGDIGFPLVAKIIDGNSGLGIKLFKDQKELKEYPDEFEIEAGFLDNGSTTEDHTKFKFGCFEEFIDFEKEFRTIWIRDRMIIVDERIPKTEDNLTIHTKDAGDKISFVYVPQDMDKVPEDFKNQLQVICNTIREKIALDIWGIDVVIEKKTGRLVVMEINSACGLTPNKILKMYKTIYEDYYLELLPDKVFNNWHDKYVKKYLQDLYSEFEKEIKQSEWRIDKFE